MAAWLPSAGSIAAVVVIPLATCGWRGDWQREVLVSVHRQRLPSQALEALCCSLRWHAHKDPSESFALRRWQW